ncbi:MAG: glycoside hydrolase family 2 [Pirellulaceae bacterium]|nr:glycoside hydrolase family 2 [Pirellulaceae bacterium]
MSRPSARLRAVQSVPLLLLAACCAIRGPSLSQAAEPWRAAEGPLTTRWAAQVQPDKVHAEYPRPQLVRQAWQNLNGLWDYAIRPRDAEQPTEFDGQILVPFAVESALSGVMKPVGPQQHLWYRRQFTVPGAWQGKRLLLHFGAVDWQTTVWVNGQSAGTHQGGYDPFSLDITDLVTDQGPQDLVVRVWDPTDAGYQPRGKQVREPHGIWYTSVTGIWQTVWLEPVAATHVRSLRMQTDIDQGTLELRADLAGNGQHHLRVRVLDQEQTVAEASGPAAEPLTLRIAKPRLWSPADPHLYDLELSLVGADPNEPPVDKLSSYFGMRKIEVGPDRHGTNRLLLNHQPLFQFGPLDQGWWPDGLYTAPTDEALRYDLEVTRQLGFNMCRKHVKVEPARWYYHCDRLGLLVWQDLPNGDRHIGPDQPDIERTPESAENFRRELRVLIDTHWNHPCIVVWVPFNEGWGQFQTNAILDWTRQYDPSRLVDGPSGWTDRGGGDMVDMHSYPGPGMPPLESKRAAVLGEFGGLGWPAPGHLWWDKRNWGYRTYHSQAELQQNYEVLIKKLRPLIGRGLAAAVYTQTTDVEGEVNGLLTYDRALLKLDANRVAPLHARLYEPPPKITIVPLVATSQQQAQTWRYTTIQPDDSWTGEKFDDSGWQQAPGGFGERSTPGSVVRTPWKTSDIWLRRSFKLGEIRGRPHLRIHHDEDAEVYLNGKRLLAVSGYVTEYVDLELDEQGAGLLREGDNTLAIHCRQTGGGQYIDAGLVGVVEEP